jgi:hypothetical protein
MAPLKVGIDTAIPPRRDTPTPRCSEHPARGRRDSRPPIRQQRHHARRARRCTPLVCPAGARRWTPPDASGFAGARELSRAGPSMSGAPTWSRRSSRRRQIVTEQLQIPGQPRPPAVSPLPSAAWIIYASGVIHPFYDGNGDRLHACDRGPVRGGRLLMIRTSTAPSSTMADARNGRPAMLIRLVAECQSR